MMHYAFDRDPDIYVKLVNLYKAKGGKAREIREVLSRGTSIVSNGYANIPSIP
jgi:hypothetical protein